jgi:dihydrofolate synthase/folylpolyglutamate synthase
VLALLEALRRGAAGERAGGARRPGHWWSCLAASRSLPGQPAVVLDVAHNPQSVAALAVNLDQMGFYPRTHAGVRGRCATRTSPACCRASRRSSTAGTCATCRCRGPRAAAELARGGGRAAAGAARHAPPARRRRREALRAALGRRGPR